MGKTKTKFIGEEVEDTKSKKKEKKNKPDKGVRAPGLGGGQRVVTIGDEDIPSPADEATVEKKESKEKKPKVRGKKYAENRAMVDKSRVYPLSEAIKLVKDTSYSSFDGSIELHLKVRKEGLSVQVDLPHSAGKVKKVEVASDKTIEKLKEGKVDFDILLSTAEMMPKLVPFARILGPRGMMPNPKNGTLVKDATAAKNFSSQKVTIKTERKVPLIHTTIGKVSQKDSELLDNAQAILKAVSERSILRAHLAATIGPSVKLNIG